jgi:hypothetical protein
MERLTSTFSRTWLHARSPGIERSEIANRRLPEGQRRRALAMATSRRPEPGRGPKRRWKTRSTLAAFMGAAGASRGDETPPLPVYASLAPPPDTFLRTWLLACRILLCSLPSSQVWRPAPHRFDSAFCSCLQHVLTNVATWASTPLVNGDLNCTAGNDFRQMLYRGPLHGSRPSEAPPIKTKAGATLR